jgi:chromosome partitioning protein
MYTIAIIAQKGGVGKTTLAVSLAVAAEQAGRSAVVFDLDPQASACNWGDRRAAEAPIVIDAQPSRLHAALDKAREGGIGFAFIDTPPRSEQAALAAAKVADLVLIPCRPQVYDLETIPNTAELLRLAGNKPAMVLLNAILPWGSRHEQARTALARMSMPVCPAMMTQRAAFGDAGTLGLTALEHDPQGKAAHEIRLVYKYVSGLLDQLTKRKVENEQSRLVECAD